MPKKEKIVQDQIQEEKRRNFQTKMIEKKGFLQISHFKVNIILSKVFE